MDNKPCPLSELEIIEVARESFEEAVSSGKQYSLVFARRLLSLAVPEVSAHSQAEPVAKTNGVVLINLGIDFAGREWVDLYDTAPPAPSSEAVKKLVEALKYAASCLKTDGNDPIDLVIAKHGTQATTPSEASTFIPWGGIGYATASAASPSDLTAYGEKVREAAAKVCDQESVLLFDRHAKERFRQCAAAIRSMPLPAQSEGDSHG
jgi:hypothetical protein